MSTIKNIIKGISDADVWTNVAYILGGWSLISLPVPINIPFSMILLGIGSGIHHHLRREVTAYFDWIPIYMVFSALAGYAMSSFPADIMLFILFSLMASLVDIIFEGKTRKYNLVVIAVFLLGAVGVNIGIYEMLRIGFLFSIAFVPWQIAEFTPKTSHTYKIFHGFWHIMTTYAIIETTTIILDISQDLL